MLNKLSNITGSKGSFRRNSMIMSGGALINIAISLLLTPIVTRLFDRSEFGIFYLFNSIVVLTSLIITGMYPHALVIPKFKRDFLAILKLCFLLSFYGMIAFVVMLFFFGDYLLVIIDGLALKPYLFLLPVGLMLTIMNMVFINWNIRLKEFKKNVTSNVSNSAGQKAVQIGYGNLIGNSFPGLIFADIIGKFISTIVLFSKSMRKDLMMFKRIKSKEVWQKFKAYKNYPTYLLPGNFINRYSSDLPLYLFSAYFGMASVGAFGFASQMLNIAYRVMGNSISPVYFQHANNLYQKDLSSLQEFTKSTYFKMLIISSLAFGFIFAFGDILFKLFFSDEWKMAGQMSMILSFFYVFKIISSPFSKIFMVVKKEHYSLTNTVVIFFLRVLGITLGILNDSLLLAVGLFSAGNAIGYLFVNYYVFQAIGVHPMKLILQSIVIVIIIFGLYYLLREGAYHIFKIKLMLE